MSDSKNIIVRFPSDVLAQVDSYTAERGGSRNAALLHLIELGMGGDEEIIRRVEAVKARLKTRIEPLLERAQYP